MTIYNNLDSSRGYAQISNNIHPQLLADIINDCDEIWSISNGKKNNDNYSIKEPFFLMFIKKENDKEYKILFKTEISEKELELWKNSFPKFDKKTKIKFMDNHIWLSTGGIHSVVGENQINIINKIELILLISRHYSKHGVEQKEKTIDFLKEMEKIFNLEKTNKTTNFYLK